MKKLIPTKYLPLLSLGCGLLSLLFGWLLYATGVDDRGLLERGNVFALLSWLPVVAAALALALGVLHLDGSPRYEDNFPASFPGGLGSFLAAAGIAVTVLTAPATIPDTLSRVWSILGLAAALCLCVAGFLRFKGAKPLFLLHVVICLFLAIHLAHRYRSWSGNPQTRDFVFQLPACIFLMVCAYCRAAFEAGAGHRRRQLYCSLMATVLCLAAVAHTDTPLFYLGCGSWCILNLCRLTPPRRRRRKPAVPTPGNSSGEVA